MFPLVSPSFCLMVGRLLDSIDESLESPTEDFKTSIADIIDVIEVREQLGGRG